MCYYNRTVKAGDSMVTDRQYRDLLEKYEELNRKYSQMSRDIAVIKMTLDLARPHKDTEPAQSHKDVTKYYFMGRQLTKRQLVLNGIKQYIADTGTKDPAALLEVFPDHIQGSLGVIRSAEQAEQYSNATDHYFFRDDDVLHLNGGGYVVSKDWTVKNIDRFIKVMETKGYEIKPINRQRY